MAEKAYVLIETEVGKTKQVAEAICKCEGVVSVDVVTGPYDAIAILEGATVVDIGVLLTDTIHRISGISRTVTCIAIKG